MRERGARARRLTIRHHLGSVVPAVSEPRSSSRRIAPPTSAHATATMRANPGRDTAPEVRLRSALHRAGLRFRKNAPLDLPAGRVRPDVVFPRLRLAVFVDGCFWHGCPEHGSRPSGNSEFWAAKIDGNRRRDADQTEWLEGEEWTVLRVWEHESIADATERILRAIAVLRDERTD